MFRTRLFLLVLLPLVPLAAGCNESSGQVVSTPIALVDLAGFRSLGLVPSGSKVFFTVDLPDTGREVWVSDGTPESTGLVVDLNPGPAQGHVGGIATFGAQDTGINGQLFFFATDGQTGIELWRTNGTEAGTELVLDANPGIGDGEYDEMVAAQNRLYFTTYDAVADMTTLWVVHVS